jgi:RNA polymerase sigma-70 factor (ECF subfamily)
MLPPGYRIMFILHDIEGYEHSEIAAIVGCSSGNTKSQLHKARKRLRQILADEELAGARVEQCWRRQAA